MKRTKLSLRIAALLLCLALAAAAAPFALAAEPAPSGFRYNHDPRLNPAAMADIVWSPTAVYGFAPSPEGSLSAYVDFDWSDAAIVESGRADRVAYQAGMQEMYELLDALTAQGKDIEEIARTISAKRNELRLAANADDPAQMAAAKQHNLEKYGNENGPTADSLYEKYGSWETVLEKAFSTNAGMDACVGLYDSNYALYQASGLAPADSEAVSREYAVSALVLRCGTEGAEAELGAFSDRESVAPLYVPWLAAAVAQGVLKGYEDGTLRPAAPLRRVEAFVLLSRLLPEAEAVREPIAFTDLPAWAAPEIDRLSAAGLLLGRGDGTLGTNDPLTAAELDTLLARLG